MTFAPRLALTLAAAALLTVASALAGPSAPAPAIDTSALWAKKKAVSALELLVRSRRGTAEEPDFLIRLADVQHEVAAIEYRVAYASAGAGTPSLTAYQAALQASLAPLNQLITQFPAAPAVPRAYYLRGKSLSELSRKEEAITDFVQLITRWPSAAETSLAYPSLWELYAERKDYTHLIESIQKRGLAPSDRLYSMALEKLSWAHYSLNDIASAVKFASEGAAHIRRVRNPKRDYAADLEKVMGNLALFYATGIAKKAPGFTAAEAIPYFKRVFPDRDFERAIIQYAYALRVSGLDSDIEVLALALTSGEYPDEVKTEVLLVSLENELNRRHWREFTATAGKLTYLAVTSAAMKKDAKGYAKAVRIFSESVAPLQTALQQASTPEGVIAAGNHPPTQRAEAPIAAAGPGAASALAAGATASATASAAPLAGSPAQPVANALMAAFRFLLDAAPDRAARASIHYNLAELATRLADPVTAANYFNLASQALSPSNSTQAKLWREASFRYLGSTYEVMKLRKILPEKLAAVPLSTPSKGLSALVSGWIDRVDDYASKAPAPLEKGVEAYLFESARLEYAAGRIESALKRLDEFAKAHPLSEFAIPAAALVMDTYVVSANWAKANSAASAYLTVAPWKMTAFAPRLMEIWCDTDYKLAEDDFKASKYKDALIRSEIFLKSPISTQSKRQADFLELAANSALALKDRATAMKYFEPLRAAHPERKDSSATAALLSATLAEEAIDYPKATHEYVHYLTLLPHGATSKDPAAQNAREKALLLSWVSGSPSLLAEQLHSNLVCPPSQERLCAGYRLRGELTRPDTDSKSLRLAAKRALDPSEADRAAWAALALREARAFSPAERLSLLEAAGDGWAKLDTLLALVAAKPLLHAASDAFADAGATARAAKLRIDKGAIDKRVKLMEKLAARFVSASRLPWITVQLAGLRETAMLFRDFSRELGAIPAPAGLAGPDLAAYRQTIDGLREPFDRKAAETIQSALTLAARQGIDSAEVRRISPETPAIGVRELVTESLTWPYDATNRPNSATLVEHFRKAVTTHSARAAYLVQEARRMKEIDPSFLVVMEGALLASFGAVPESLASLASGRKDVEAKRKPAVYTALIAGRYVARDPEGARKLLEEIGVDKIQPAPAWLAEANKWATAERAPAAAPTAATPTSNPAAAAAAAPTSGASP